MRKVDKSKGQFNCEKLLNPKKEEDEYAEDNDYAETSSREKSDQFVPKYKLTEVEIEDFEELLDFVNDPSTHYFGIPKFKSKFTGEFFEDGVTHRIKMTYFDNPKEIIAYAEIITHLPIQSLPAEFWEEYFGMHYCIPINLNFCNTVFIKHFSYDVSMADPAFFEIANEVFLRENRVNNIVAMEMPIMDYHKKQHFPDYTPMRKFSQVFYPKMFSVKYWNVTKIHINTRDAFIQKMVYRKAVTEDNDDLVEIVDLDYPEIRQKLGDYYIAEEILDGQAGKNQSTILCVEIDNNTSGFMWFNTNINVEFIIKNYDVDLFEFLISTNPNHPQKQLILNSYSIQELYASSIFAQENIQEVLDMFKKERKVKRCQRKNSLDNLPLGTLSGVEKVNKYRHHAYRKVLEIFELLTKTLLNFKNYANLIEKKIVIPYNVTEDEDDINMNSNVFAIQLFGLAQGIDVRRIFRMLLSAFCVYPHLDYCILTMAPTMHISKGAEELMKYFIPVLPRPGSPVIDRLYITHRSAIHGDIRVQPVTMEDIEAVDQCLLPEVKRRSGDLQLRSSRNLLSEVDAVREILQDVLSNPESHFKFLTITIGNSSKPDVPQTVVGFVVLREFAQTYFLKKHFRLQPCEDTNKIRCEIITLVLHPLYHCMSDELFREIARFMNVWQFYYFVPLKSSKKCLKNDLASYMQPLETQPIKKAWFISPKEVDLNSFDKIYKLGSLDLINDYYAVFQRSLLPTKYFTNPRRIMIYGFTEYTKAFLRLLIFMWKSHQGRHINNYTCVTRLDCTVIVPPGVADCEFDHDFKCDTCENPKYCYTNLKNNNAFIRDTTHRMDLRVWVQFVYSTIESIDREEKHVLTKDKCIYHYDDLVFMNHRRYELPLHLQTDTLPYNMAQINSKIDKIQLYYKLKTVLKSKKASDFQILIYGPHIAPFECLEFLLTHGFNSSQITMVIPYVRDLELHDKYNMSHSDIQMEYKLQNFMESIGVKIDENYNLIDIIYHDGGKQIAALVFQHYSTKEERTIITDFLINYNEMYLDVPTKKLLDSCDIKTTKNYILVNEKYQTNDPCIYALGDYIQHVKEPNHQYRWVAPREACEKLMLIMGLGFFTKVEGPLAAKYHYNNYYEANLPGGYKYVKVTIPKRFLRNHPSNEYTSSLKTLKTGFCRVRVSPDDIVEEICVATRVKKNYDFLQFFCGKHESLLNDLRGRYCYGEIPCFIEFFQEPWTELVAHDFFMYEVSSPIRELLRKYLEENFDFNMSRCERLKQLEEDIPPERLEEIVLDFLRRYRFDFDYSFALPEDFPQDSLMTPEHNIFQ